MILTPPGWLQGAELPLGCFVASAWTAAGRFDANAGVLTSGATVHFDSLCCNVRWHRSPWDSPAARRKAKADPLLGATTGQSMGSRRRRSLRISRSIRRMADKPHGGGKLAQIVSTSRKRRLPHDPWLPWRSRG